MTSRLKEGLLVGLLLLTCVAAIFFVFKMMTRPGGSFSQAERAASRVLEGPAPPAARPGPEPLADPVPAPSKPPAKPEQVPEEAGDEKANPDKSTKPPKEPFQSAELTLELLVPAAEPDRLVSVEVRDEQGAPIPDTLVVFRAGSYMLYRERTDEQGLAGYAPPVFERGPFRVDAVADGFVPDTSPAVAPGATTELILKARPLIEGVVRAPSRGSGIVKLFTSDTVLETDIANDGTFVFTDLDEGYVTVQAEVAPYGADSHTFYLHGGTRRFVKLNIRNKQLRIYGVIQHWVHKGSATINGIKVPVSPSGSYVFEKAVIGVNEIEVDAPGKALFKQRFSVKGLAKSRYDFSLKREATIRGRVRSERTGRPVAGAMVRLGVAFGNPRNDRVPYFPVNRVPLVKTDGDGKFEITRLDRRLIYMLSVVAQGFGQALVDNAVPDGGHRTIKLPEGPFLFGKLRGLGGVPRHAVVTAVRLEKTPKGRVFNVADYDGSRSGRDRKGFFGLSGLLPGTYLVRVEAEGYGSIETVVDMLDAPRTRLDLRMRRGHDVEDRDAELLRRLPPIITSEPLPEDPTPSEATILHVDVRRNPDQEPFLGVRVSFWEGEEELAPRMAFTELEFDLLGLPEGSYRAILTHPLLDKPLVADNFAVRRGRVADLVLR